MLTSVIPCVAVYDGVVVIGPKIHLCGVNTHALKHGGHGHRPPHHRIIFVKCTLDDLAILCLNCDCNAYILSQYILLPYS